MRGVIQVCSQLFDISKIFLLISVVCFAPQILFRDKKRSALPVYQASIEGTFKLGIENVNAEFLINVSQMVSPRIALISHYTTQHDQSDNIAVLKKKGIDIAKIFYPYQGMFVSSMQHEERYILGDIPACMVKKTGFDDYALQDIDLLLVDIQDVGLGFVSGVSLLFQALRAAVVYKIPVVILDRPNVLGNKIEGSLLGSSLLHGAIPLRYGMTFGELGSFYNAHVLGRAANLHVVPMQNYHRVVARDDSGVRTFLPYTASVDAALSFSVCGMLAQVSPFDVGMQTPYAYQCIALPKSVGLSEQRWYQLQIMLRDIGVESSLCSYFSKQKQEQCRGLRLHIEEVHKIDSFNVVLKILEFFKHSGVVLGFSDDFDQAVGTSMVREYIQGKIARHLLVQAVNEGLEEFYRKAFGSFMYYPLPQVALI